MNLSERTRSYVLNIFKKLKKKIVRLVRFRSPKSIDGYGTEMQMSPRERVYIANLLINNKTFLELGSGYSTLWFSQFANHIVSVESRKKWFMQIKKYLTQYNITNVEIILSPPESCAYDEKGQEAWNNRNTPEGSDYGAVEEFLGYLYDIERLLGNNDFNVVLVDGHVRDSVINLLRDKRYRGIILLHDVIPERDYLNKKILTMEGLKVIRQVDSLVELVVC